MNRVFRLSVLLLMLAGFAVWAANLPWRSGPVQSGLSSRAGGAIETMMNRLAEQERTFDLTQAQIDFVRTFTVQYDPSMENGATVLNLHSGQSTPALVLSRLWDHFLFSDTRKSELDDSFQIFLAFAELAPGRYPVAPGDVTDYRPGTGDADRVKLPAEFQFTSDHLKLLHNASARWDTFYDTLIINPKRPYGDMSYFEIDMAEILGVPLERDAKGDPKISPAVQARFDALFADLPLSLRIFLKHASIAPGRFYRKPAGWGAWRRLSSNCPSAVANWPVFRLKSGAESSSPAQQDHRHAQIA